MKLVIERAPLLRVLGHLSSIVERRSTIPILGNVLMVAEEGRLSLSATDMDIELRETLAAGVGRPGTITVPVRTFYDVARKLREGAQVELDADIERAREKKALVQMVVRSGRSTFTIPTLPPEDYPKINAVNLPHAFVLPASDLCRLIDATRFAISTEETRYYLNGIFLHAVEGEEGPMLRGVATDGHRLARCDIYQPEGAGGMPGIIVPRKTVIEVRKLLEDAGKDAEVAIRLSDTKIEFTVDGSTMISKVIDGTFPDYNRVIPTGNDKVIGCVRKDLAEAVDRVSTISTERSRAVKLAFAEGGITLSVSSPDTGIAVEELDARYAGAALDVGFNARYLLDITGQLGGDDLEFSLADPGSPALIADPANRAALFVLMPMRV